MIVNPVSWYLPDKTGKGITLLIIGSLMQFTGIFITGLTLSIHEMLFIAGFGSSLFWAPSTTLVVDSTVHEFRSIANGSLFTLRYIALIIGISLLPLFLLFYSHYISSGFIVYMQT